MLKGGDIMTRMVISLDEADKRWLDERATADGVSRAEVVRRSLRVMRDLTPLPRMSFDALLEGTAGLDAQEDGASLQTRLREEWDERSS